MDSLAGSKRISQLSERNSPRLKPTYKPAYKKPSRRHNKMRSLVASEYKFDVFTVAGFCLAVLCRRLASTPEITSASAKGSRPGRFFHPTRVANVYCPGNAISLWVSMLLHWKYAWLIGWILHFNCTTKFRGNGASLFLSDLMNKLEFFLLIGNWLNWRIPAIVKLWLDQVSIIYIIGYEILLNIYIYHHNICLLFFIFLFFFMFGLLDVIKNH